MKCREVRFSGHALRRMFEREISVAEVMRILDEGDTIESYDRERPYPSRLLLGRIGGRTIHVVVAREETGGVCYVVTAYPPDPALWEDDFKTRRSP